MLLLDSGALSALAHGPAGRRERELIIEMRRRELPISTVAAADVAGRAVVVTADPVDLHGLAESAKSVVIADL